MSFEIDDSTVDYSGSESELRVTARRLVPVAVRALGAAVQYIPDSKQLVSIEAEIFEQLKLRWSVKSTNHQITDNDRSHGIVIASP